MGFRYRADKDILKMLKDAGYSSYRLQKEGKLSQSTMTKIRNKQMISLSQIEIICKLLKRRPEEIIEYVDDDVT